MAGLKPFYSLTPCMADLVRIVAELEAAGTIAGYRLVAAEMDVNLSIAWRAAIEAAERGWLILPRDRRAGLRIAPAAPLHRLFGNLKEHDLAVTGAGHAAMAHGVPQ